MDNIVEIKNKPYTCRNCKTSDLVCHRCQIVLRDDDFYYWLILTKLIGNNSVMIRFASNLSNKGTKIIELMKNSVGLFEKRRRTVRLKCDRLELLCKCGNKLSVFITENSNPKSYTCMKCMGKDLKVISKSDVSMEVTEVVLEKLSAVIAATERK